MMRWISSLNTCDPPVRFKNGMDPHRYFLMVARLKMLSPPLSIFALCLMLPVGLYGQTMPTVQQSEFRQQWVGEQVDQIPLGGILSPGSSLGSVVGSLQTPDQVKREVDASLTSLNAPPAFSVKPAMTVGWQVANYGVQTGTNSSSGPQSSAFAAPTIAFLYDRDHGAWTISSGYSGGFKYYANPNYTGAGSGSSRNPFSLTAFLRAILEMDRYSFSFTVNGSAGNGYDSTSGSYNIQTTTSLGTDFKYNLSESWNLDATAGYSFANATGSSATPNNSTSSMFAALAAGFDYSPKTHFRYTLSLGQSLQNLQQGTVTAGGPPLQSNTAQKQTYAQELNTVKYDFTDKLVVDLGLGVRYLSDNVTNSSSAYTGLLPSWTAGVGYTPTSKISIRLATGMQASDVVPEFNLSLNWNPREKTMFVLGLSQTEGFANSVAGQYIVSRGVNMGITQQLQSNLQFSITGGYATQNYLNLSNTTASGQSQSTSQLPSNLLTSIANLVWNIRDWVSLVNSLTYSSGLETGGSSTVSNNKGGSSYNNNNVQYTYSISLNFAF
jgi:hypothetical protein